MMINMKRTCFIAACASLLVSGCAPVEHSLAKYDRSSVYLNSDKFMANRVTVPEDLDSSNIEDYYVVPSVATQNNPSVPDLHPPADNVAAKSKDGDVV